MADTPNPEDLAKLYLEFWQQPLAGLTRDPQVAESIARMFDLMTAGAATFAKIVAGERPPRESGDRGASMEARGSPPVRGDMDSPARAATEARLDQIARRVAELERRIAGLEPRASARRTGSQSRPRRPRRPS